MRPLDRMGLVLRKKAKIGPKPHHPIRAMLDPDQHALAVDIGDLECRDLGYTEASASRLREPRFDA